MSPLRPPPVVSIICVLAKINYKLSPETQVCLISAFYTEAHMRRIKTVIWSVNNEVIIEPTKNKVSAQP